MYSVIIVTIRKKKEPAEIPIVCAKVRVDYKYQEVGKVR